MGAVERRGRILAFGLLAAIWPSNTSQAQPRSAEAGDVSLSDALAQAAREAGVDLLFRPEDVAGRRAPQRPPELEGLEVVEWLLDGAGLALARDASGAFLVARAVSADAASDAILPVVVTARRRAEILNDAPIAVSVFGADLLQRVPMARLSDIARRAPGLQIVENATGQRRISVRGVQSAGEASTGFYLGEIPITGPTSATADPSSMTPNIAFVDIDRIEVLRGPQGALYGASAMSGAVRIIPESPHPDGVDAGGAVGVDWTEEGGLSKYLSAMANAPISDRVAVRMAAYAEDRAGFIDNVRLGEYDVNGARAQGARVMLGYEGERLRLTGAAMIHDERIEDASVYFPAAGDLETDQHVRLPFPNNFRLYSLVGEWGGGAVDATVSAAYYEWSATRYIDSTRPALAAIASAEHCPLYLAQSVACSPEQQTAYRAWAAAQLPLVGRQPMDVRAWTHEARLRVSPNEGFSYTVGIFVENRDDDAESGVVRADGSGRESTPLIAVGARRIGVETEQQAVFGEAQWRMSEALRATFGARLYRYRKAAHWQTLVTNYFNGSRAGAPQAADADASGWVKSASVEYRPASALLVYAQIADGFRPGGVNNVTDLPDRYVAFEPDALRSYEIGLKADFARENHVRAAAYWIDWDNMQVNTVFSGRPFQFVSNAGASRIVGLELEGAVSPMEGLALSTAFTVRDIALVEDQLNEAAVGAGRRGDRIPFEPEFMLQASAIYERPLAEEARARFGVDYEYTGASMSLFRADAHYAEEMGDYGVWSAHAALAGRRWEVSLHLQNALDERGAAKVLSSVNSERATIPSAPRRVSVELSWRM